MKNESLKFIVPFWITVENDRNKEPYHRLSKKGIFLLVIFFILNSNCGDLQCNGNIWDFTNKRSLNSSNPCVTLCFCPYFQTFNIFHESLFEFLWGLQILAKLCKIKPRMQKMKNNIINLLKILFVKLKINIFNSEKLAKYCSHKFLH